MTNFELLAKQFAILDHMPVGAFVLQEDLVVIFWNSRLEDWTGIPRRKILGENITTHFPNLKTPSYTLRIQDVFNTGMSFIFSPYLHKYSIPIMLPDHQTQIQATTVTRVPGLNDTESYVLFSIQDVTELAYRIRDYRRMRDQAQREVKERQQAERALQQVNTELAQKNAQLKELNASKDKFFSIISHDLRSPFNTLLGFAQLLEENLEHYSLDEIRHKVGRVLTSAERLYGLLENLLTWSRVQRGGMEYRPETVDVAEMTTENMELFLPKAEQKQITLTSAVQEHILAYADPSMVDTIMRNLVSNALKFTSTGGSIMVSAATDDHFVEVAVADTGVGIPAEILPQLLRIDTQYTKVGTAGETGTGLGLILCKELIEQNGGRIWAESQVGKGTTFRFTLLKAAGV